MLPETEHILLEQQADTLTIWFNRPEARNALSAPVIDDLALVLEALPGQADIRFVILRGKGGVFCAGGDLKMFKTVFQGEADREEIIRSNADFGRLMKAVRAVPQLFLVVIEGAAMAGGLGLACLADVTLATRDARFALTEVTLGIPPAQITPVIMERIGPSEARRLLLTAARFDGEEAQRLGLVHFVETDAQALAARTEQLLQQARGGAPGAIAATKQIINATGHLAGDELVRFAAEQFADCMLGEEAREGLEAFADKRKPAWNNTGTA
ncbi:enoyl-CoA hydratase [Seongchinamella sediminis]|uniref:Enoyl-CoA hydratase n=1 Tax=Seongchinamella sediminis TaxID=2283635 RepID=A0A3L7DXQ8_9GAMM|nr:enoyl-CoA hydratase-related protein [Seongchinamella sediminis]RLQ22044.1 enoyl-CoA hydratase [Seongchinamella sediminis]